MTENIFFYKAKAWASLKEFSRSNDLLKTCVGLAISKNAEMYYYNLALNYEAMKQYKKAVANYDTAYYLFKKPVMNYNSGHICEINLKNSTLAKKYYTEYLSKANPVEADEKKAYQYLKNRGSKKISDVNIKEPIIYHFLLLVMLLLLWCYWLNFCSRSYGNFVGIITSF